MFNNMLEISKMEEVYDFLFSIGSITMVIHTTVKNRPRLPYRTHFGCYPLTDMLLQENFNDFPSMKEKRNQTHTEPTCGAC